MDTDFLTACPSRLSGWARLLDLFGVFDDYNTSPTRPLADARALYADWIVTGEDVQRALLALRELQRAESGQGELFPEHISSVA